MKSISKSYMEHASLTKYLEVNHGVKIEHIQKPITELDINEIWNKTDLDTHDLWLMERMWKRKGLVLQKIKRIVGFINCHSKISVSFYLGSGKVTLIYVNKHYNKKIQR